MTITKTQSGSDITLAVEGRVDTNTAVQLQSQILAALQTSSLLILDLEHVPYVSSAGLRAFLIGQKTANSKQTAMELIHVQPVVMNTLETVGFSNLLTIR